jgi:hypothetical protein
MDLVESIVLSVAVLGLVCVIFEAELRGHFRLTREAWATSKRLVRQMLQAGGPGSVL